MSDLGVEAQHILGRIIEETADERRERVIGVESMMETMQRFTLGIAWSNPEAFVTRALGHEALAEMNDRHHYKYVPHQVKEALGLEGDLTAFYYRTIIQSEGEK